MPGRRLPSSHEGPLSPDHQVICSPLPSQKSRRQSPAVGVRQALDLGPWAPVQPDKLCFLGYSERLDQPAMSKHAEGGLQSLRAPFPCSPG